MRGACLALALLPAIAEAQIPEYHSPLTGVTYVSQRDTGAVARATSQLDADPRNVDLIIRLALAQASVRQYREAIARLTRGIAFAPDNATLLLERGHRYISVREFDSALADLTRGNRLDTNNYGIWYHLGVVRFVTGDFSGAADAFAHAQPRSPDMNEMAGATDWLWMSLSRAGRPGEAAAALARFTPEQRARVTTATAYLKRLTLYGGDARPETLIGPADTSDIQVATLSYGIGNWYLLRGDSAEARRWFRRSVESGGWPAFGFIASERELRER